SPEAPLLSHTASWFGSPSVKPSPVIRPIEPSGDGASPSVSRYRRERTLQRWWGKRQTTFRLFSLAHQEEFARSPYPAGTSAVSYQPSAISRQLGRGLCRFAGDLENRPTKKSSRQRLSAISIC